MVMQRYHITQRDDYKKYASLTRMIQKLVSAVKQIDAKDSFRVNMTDNLLEKLYNMGVIPTRQSITLCESLTVSSFCRSFKTQLNGREGVSAGDSRGFIPFHLSRHFIPFIYAQTQTPAKQELHLDTMNGWEEEC
ncbi:unnamed protein product [Vicia faba]|nr:unnamed protein product [Vicia faba]CAI8599278.1 unnamed protein product [Vicia faba]CAI8612402.1 unnamed protein product [Vicia faba]